MFPENPLGQDCFMVSSHQEKDRHAGAFRQPPFSCDIFLANALGLCSDSPNPHVVGRQR